MPKQQKRRRKRYAARSAYAGDVKPPGIFALFSDVRLIRAVFVLMAVGLVAGGFAVVFAPDILFSGTSTTAGGQSFVLPDSDNGNDDDPLIIDGVDARQFDAPPAITIDSTKTYTATIRTELGDIVVELMPGQATEAVNSFVFLANEGFYDGLIFHYGDGSFSANAGDPACQAGSASNCRGDGGPGYELTGQGAGEFDLGVLGLSNASQFFITLTDSETSLEQFAGFTAFGRVSSGLDVAQQVVAGTEIQSIEVFEN